MAIDQNGPEASAPTAPDTGVGEAWSKNRPVDWDPPPGNPGSDQDGQLDRDNGSARTQDEQAGSGDGEVPLPADDEGPIEEEMHDVEANNSVSAEHPQSR